MTDNAKHEAGSPEWLQVAESFFFGSHPLFNSLGLKVENISDDKVSIRATLAEDFEFEENSNLLHTGVFTIILDTVFGFAVLSKLKNLQPIATINLKTEYIAPAISGAQVLCDASCYAICGDIAHVRGEIYDLSREHVFATATAAFMIGTRGPDFRVQMRED